MHPRALRPGDTIGILAPSWSGPAAFPHRVERGLSALSTLGYRTRVAPHTFGSAGYVSAGPEERVADLHDLFADPDVTMIMAAIGGDHACHLLPLIDWELIRRSPKIFIGFSDITVLNLAIYQRTGLTTFNGPALMADLAEFPQPYAYTMELMRRVLCRPEPAGAIDPAPAWTDEFLDWAGQLDLTRPRAMQPSPGWRPLKPGRAAGPLIGGCLESLQHLRGTPYWPNLEGAILFIETSEERPTPAWVDAVLQDYENMGVFAGLQGMLVGRPMG
ncbi:MAG TPA: S66 peptidase family protein, partial [Chloroflexota bacterium]|nr:S66 peptidase family protein [Chloroflexota bacterium]